MCSGSKWCWPTARCCGPAGKFVKCSSGYDLTQLLIGSEGTLAITTEVTVKLQPRFTASSTVLAPFATLVRGGAGRAAHRAQRHQPLHPRVRRRAGDGRHHPGGRARPRRTRRGPGPHPGLPRGRPGRHGPRPGGGGRRAPRARCWRSWGRSTSTCCRRHREPSSSPPGRERSSSARRPGATTSSTPCSPGRPSPTTWPRWPCWPRSTAPSSPGAATSATATCTSRSSSPTRNGGTPSCTPASSWRCTSAAQSRASTASGRRSCRTSSSCRIRCRWISCAPSSGPSTRTGILGPDRLLGMAQTETHS